MSSRETPMIKKFWNSVGGTLIEEFQMVRGSNNCGPRRADAVIVPSGSHEALPRGKRTVSVEGKDVVVVQAKCDRLGMYLMGQGVFSAELIKPFKPKSVRSVILCTKDDAVLRPLLARHNVEVHVMPEFAAPRLSRAASKS
jgi:hypothetical protein